MIGELYPGEFDAMEHNGRMDALEQEPCSDLISKEDTLKAMSNTWSHICYVARRKKPTKGEEAVYSDMVGTVKNLPPATAEPCDVFDEYGNYKYPSDVELTEPNTATSMPCPNAISRSDMLDAVGHDASYTSEELQRIIKDLPPVNPQPKTGCWIEIDEEPHEVWECDHCGFVIDGSGCIDPYDYRDTYKFCPNCGAKMVEPQESEG